MSRVISRSGVRCVAKKISLEGLNEKEKQQMYQEVLVSKMVQDPNIVGTFDAFFGKDKIVIIMEHCNGKF